MCIDSNPIAGRENKDRHRFVETLNISTAEEIVNRVLSVIDPAG
jgi:hypothetical protein